MLASLNDEEFVRSVLFHEIGRNSWEESRLFTKLSHQDHPNVLVASAAASETVFAYFSSAIYLFLYEKCSRSLYDLSMFSRKHTKTLLAIKLFLAFTTILPGTVINKILTLLVLLYVYVCKTVKENSLIYLRFISHYS